MPVSAIPQNVSGLPFDDIRTLIGQLPPGDTHALEIVTNRNKVLDKPVGSLGKLEEICEWLALWSGKSPQVIRPLVAVFAGTHKIAGELDGDEASNATLVAVTSATAGGAAVNQACAVQDAGLKIFDLALQIPVGNICQEAALDERGCAATIAFGMEAVVGGTDLMVLCDTGKGNEVSSAALLAALWGGNAASWVTPGAGEDEGRLKRRHELVEQALFFHKGQLDDPLEALRRLGGREHAALVGAMLAARVQKVPVVLDGLASLAAASVIAAMQGDGVAHCMMADGPGAGAGSMAVEKLALEHVSQLGISSGDGTAGAIAIGIIRTAAQIHADMAAGEEYQGAPA